MLSKRALTIEVQKLWQAVEAMRANMPTRSLPAVDAHRRLLTIREATSLYRIGRRRLMGLIDKGRLPAIQQPTTTGNGCRWRLRREDCDALLDRPEVVR
jgi:hypothetical protein